MAKDADRALGTERTYIAIDLKSFFASVECVERGLDPLSTNLLVADLSRTDKTICLAVSPSLKSYGIGGRARLFEVKERLRKVNNQRLSEYAHGCFSGKSYIDTELRTHPDWEVDYIIAPPRMSKYIEYSTRIYQIYLKYIAAEDIHVYSIDEVFIDATAYEATYKMSAHNLTMVIIREILKQTGITATAGIGTNLYLCKIAMDIMAKHTPADSDGVRIAFLNEELYRQHLWNYKPITKFWQVGRGTAEKLAIYGIDTMGKLARCSLSNEALLYNLFGSHAELLIDHAWGWEPCTMAHIKTYQPKSQSLSSSQVLTEPYTFNKAMVVAKEMADATALKLLCKRLVTDQIVLTISYDTASLTLPDISLHYHGEIVTDRYGRRVPKHVHGSIRLDTHTSSSLIITEAVCSLYHKIVHPHLLIRRISISANHILSEYQAERVANQPIQLELFANKEQEQRGARVNERLAKERRLEEARKSIKEKFGKNSILKGLNFQEGATAIERNKQIGGHKA